MKKQSEIVMAIGDLHTPFQHKDSLPFLKAVAKKYRPTQIVCMGDEIDAHAMSDYDHDPDGMSAGDELKASIKELKAYYKTFPSVKVCVSNHTARPYRKAVKSGLPKAVFKSYREFLEAPKGWEWRERWEIDGVIYQHGDPYAGKDAAIKWALSNFKPTVIGHLHSWAGIQYYANSEALLFGFNVGCLIDRHAYAFNYGSNNISKPVIGVGIIDKGIPVFVPMVLNGDGRWQGSL